MYDSEPWLINISNRIEQSPFKGYLTVELSPAGFPYLKSTTSSIRYDNRERAYWDVFCQIDELCHEAWLDYKQSLKE